MLKKSLILYIKIVNAIVVFKKLNKMCDICGRSKCRCAKIIDREGLRGPQGPKGPMGPAGPTGPGATGLNSFTLTTASFLQPSIGSNVTISVSTAGQNTGDWAALGQIIFVAGGGYYQVITPGTTSITIKNLGYAGNTVAGITIIGSKLVCPGGIKGTDATTTLIIPGIDAIGEPYRDVTGLGYKVSAYTVPTGGGGLYSIISTANVFSDDTQDVTMQFFVNNAGATLQGNVDSPSILGAGTQTLITAQCTGFGLTDGDILKVGVKSTGTNARMRLLDWHIFKTS